MVVKLGGNAVKKAAGVTGVTRSLSRGDPDFIEDLTLSWKRATRLGLPRDFFDFLIDECL